MKSCTRGFTLVELLVVIAIMVVMTAIVVSNFTKPRAQARDSQRMSDLGQLQLAINLYYDRCSQYPAALDFTTSSCTDSLGTVIKLSTFIGKIPVPPSGAVSYDYATDATFTNYILHTTLENSNSAQKNSLQLPVTGITPAFSCYDGLPANKNYCLGPK